MKFIAEFETNEDILAKTKYRDYVSEKRHIMEVRIGGEISAAFGWQNPVNHNLDHHRLEIEAFPMDKWVEFKSMLFSELRSPAPNEWYIDLLFKELESFGKPAGEANKLKQ